ncbi:DMT family transporter [Bellilinea sp.]|uniref:DMT family transporter n=1 Tax=Bellilinea sp. TaxID=2838785 RepID=UPI002ADD5A0E|nr:DMT family transporter [Bellilinea sp.]
MDAILDLLTSPFGGGLAALTAAFLWALASVWFTRLGSHLSVIEVNFLKGMLALILLVITLYLSGGGLQSIPANALGLLLVSGVIGITLGDSAYLQALQHLGPRRTLLLATLAPPMVGLIAWGVLGETLAWTAWLGILLTVAGIAWVILERTPDSAPAFDLKLGLLFGFLAALSQSVALVLSRVALTRTSVDSLQSTILRLAAAVVVLAVWSLLRRKPLLSRTVFQAQPHLWATLAAATFIGTYLAMWLQQVSISLAPAGIVQTLLSASPLFILPIAALQGQKITPRAVLGALLALGGVALLFTG